jgi:hypothetical protein
MKSKKIVLGILVMLLVLGMAVVGCDNENSDSNITYVAVKDIINVPSTMPFGSPLSLNGTVLPDNATNKTIIWSVKTANNSGAAINGNVLSVTNVGNNWGGIIVNAVIYNGETEDTDYSQDFLINISCYNKATETFYFRNTTFNWAADESLLVRDFLQEPLKKLTSYKIVIKGNLDVKLDKVYCHICTRSPEEQIYDWIYVCETTKSTPSSVGPGQIQMEFTLTTSDDSALNSSYENPITKYGNNAFIGIWGFDKEYIATDEATKGMLVAKITNFSWTITELE